MPAAAFAPATASCACSLRRAVGAFGGCLSICVADERDDCLRDLKEIGRMLGCDHVHDGLAPCVRDVLNERDELKAMTKRNFFREE